MKNVTWKDLLDSKIVGLKPSGDKGLSSILIRTPYGQELTLSAKAYHPNGNIVVIHGTYSKEQYTLKEV